MIAYFKCLCKSAHRIKAAELKARGYDIRITNTNSVYRYEASLYSAKLPFSIKDGEVKEL